MSDPTASYGAVAELLEHPLLETYVTMRAFGAALRAIDVVIAEIRTKSPATGARVLLLHGPRPQRAVTLRHALPAHEFVARDGACFDEVVAALRPGSLDVVAAVDALHRIERLEELWTACRSALRPGGVVMGVEYVGADGFAWPGPVLRAAERARELLPAELRAATVAAPSRGDWRDPDAARRPQQIVSTLEAAGFTLFGRAGGGGGLFLPTLLPCASSLRPDDWEHHAAVARLLAREDEHMRDDGLADAIEFFVTEPRA